jgi:integrase
MIDFRVKQENRSVLDKSTQKGRAAAVDINDVLYEALVLSRRWARSNYVIEWNGKPVSSLKKSLGEAFKRAGIEGKFNGSHLLRHSLATWIADAGYDLRIVQRLFGHKTPKSTSRYAKHQRGYLSPAVSVVNRPILPADARIASEPHGRDLSLAEPGKMAGKKGV